MASDFIENKIKKIKEESEKKWGKSKFIKKIKKRPKKKDIPFSEKGYCSNCKHFTYPNHCDLHPDDDSVREEHHCSLFDAKPQVHKVQFPSGILKITNYIHNVELFHEQQPFFYDKSKLFWFWEWETSRWKIVDEIDLMNSIDDGLQFGGDTVTSKVRSNYLEAFKRVGRKKTPKDIKKTMVQFKNKLVDVKTGEETEPTHELFVTNPIPWNIGESEDTPIMDNLFKEWVGEDNVKKLYEIIAYCCLPSYPIHRIFGLVGSGLNGKGTFLNLLIKFVGIENCTSTELDLLISNPRFETSKLYKKLVCTMGETNFNEMKKTSLLKRLSGGDLIGYEFKNKTPFDDYNYAKILIATNSLPTTSDRTIGFYRRWDITDFPNRFDERRDILGEIPDVEYENLAKKCVTYLKRLVKTRKFTNEGTIEERQKRYEDRSDPLQKFLRIKTLKDSNGHIFKYEFTDVLQKWMVDNGFRVWNKKEVGIYMKDHYEEGRRNAFVDSYETKQYWAWLGLRFKPKENLNDVNNEKEDSRDSRDSRGISLSSPYEEMNRNTSTMSTMSTIASTTPLPPEIEHINIPKKGSSKGNEGVKEQILDENLPKSDKQKVYEVLIDIHNKVDLIYFIDLIKIVKEKHKIDEVDCESIIETLKKEGVIFEVKPGILQVLE